VLVAGALKRWGLWTEENLPTIGLVSNKKTHPDVPEV
jgi:hypothetical protein